MAKKNNKTTSYTVLLGGYIARERKNRGFSQHNFAQKAGMSQPSLSKIETGQTVINIIQLRNICRLLNKELHEMISEVENLASDLQRRGIKVEDHNPNQGVRFFLGAAAIAGILALLTSE